MRASYKVWLWRGAGPSVLALGAVFMLHGTAMQAADTTPTFTKDVAPILQQKCESCHRAEGMAPMSLTTYDEARPWVKSIAQKVGTHQMPPWDIDRTVGIQKFKNDRSLSDDQIETITKWANNGAPKGDAKDMPAPLKWPEGQGWMGEAKLGKPDLVVKSTPWTVPAEGQDAWWRPLIPTNLTEDRWVKAIEIRPATVPMRKVTHHALARLQQQEDPSFDRALFTNDPNVAGDGLFMEWAVGKNVDEMEPGSGRLMRKGANISFEMHYHSVGEEVKDATVELGVWFYPKGQEPKHREVLALFNAFSGSAAGARGLDIAPNAITTTESFVTLRENARIENFQVHQHLRGKGMSMEAINPANGQRTMLSQVVDFKFNWMNMYIYADDAAPLLPKGTILHLVAWYDNTKANKSNPDPDQWVGYGDRTVDEMGHAWLNITYYNDEDFKAELAKRAAATTSTTQQQQQ